MLILRILGYQANQILDGLRVEVGVCVEGNHKRRLDRFEHSVQGVELPGLRFEHQSMVEDIPIVSRPARAPPHPSSGLAGVGCVGRPAVCGGVVVVGVAVPLVVWRRLAGVFRSLGVGCSCPRRRRLWWGLRGWWALSMGWP